jgi:hypothetical protein
MNNKLFNSEEKLKKAMESYQAPLDNNAFEQFSKALDNNPGPSATTSTGLMSSSFIKGFLFTAIIGIAVLGFYISNESTGADKDFSSVDNTQSTEVASQNSTIQQYEKEALLDESLAVLSSSSLGNNKETLEASSTAQDRNVGLVSGNESESVSQSASKTKAISETGTSEFRSSSSNTELASGSAVKENSPSFNQSSLSYRNSTVSTVSTNIDTNLRNSKSVNNSFYNNGTSSASASATPSNFNNSATSTVVPNKVQKENSDLLSINQNQKFEVLSPLDKSEIALLENSKVLENFVDVEVTLPIIKYKRHFYFGTEIGIAREYNYATIDNTFESISFLDPATLGYHVRLKAGYQLSANTALELTLQMKDNSLHWDLSQGLFEPFDTRVQNIPIIGLRTVNSFSLFKGLKLNTTLGYNIGFNIPFFESQIIDVTVDGAFAGLESVLFDSDFRGTNSRVYHLVEAGVGFEYQFTNNLSFTSSLSYFQGFNEILNNRIQYIAGEGNLGDFEVSSRGGFTSLDLGLIYRFRSY